MMFVIDKFKKMVDPGEPNLSLIPPKVPELTASDRLLLKDITSPDVTCIKDIKVTLAGFKSNIDTFYD